MMGRQSYNTGIRVVPAPGPVRIDGDLADWDLSGRIWSFADIDMRDRFSIETAMMWDKDYLYVGFQWNDPTPMVSGINPDFDPDKGWQADSVQMRVRTDQVLWLTTWYYTAEKRPVMLVDLWKNPTSHRDGVVSRMLKAEPGGTALGEGVEMAFRQREDGTGFNQEIRIPWKLLYEKLPAIEPGLIARMGLEFLWGDPSGQLRPVHRYADNLQPDATSRMFFWSATTAWGDLELVAKGNVAPLVYVAESDRLLGSIPVQLSLPADATRFTAVIEDAQGNRIRNLAGNQLVVDYALKDKKDGDQIVVEVPWDGLDDHGRLVSPGTYQTRGLTHRGIGAEFDAGFYNPGTPPWHTPDKTGAWGANHTPPRSVARIGDSMAVVWPMSEGGHATIGVNNQYRKFWGELRGAKHVAGDEKHFHAFQESRHSLPHLYRLDAKTGGYLPYIDNGVERPFELRLTEIFGEEDAGSVNGMALHGQHLALARSNGKLAILDHESARPVGGMDVPGIAGLAFGPDGKLYAVADAGVVELDWKAGKSRVVPTPGLESGGAIAVDLEGNILVFDLGPDSQIKAYSPEGKQVYTMGRKGGRPLRGAFDNQAMIEVTSIAVDARGEVWAAEHWDFPRRVSIWKRDGTLSRDFIGNTNYGATNTYLHEQDPSLAYVGPNEMILDRENMGYQMNRVLWVPGEGEFFPLSTGTHAHAQRFRSAASGKMREYLFAPPYRNWMPHVVFMQLEDGSWQPVSAFGQLGGLSGDEKWIREGQEKMPPGLTDLNPHDGFFWSDKNGDGKVDREELTILPALPPARAGTRPLPPIALGSGWGTRMSPHDLSIVLYSGDGYVRYRPSSFDKLGAPVYTPESMEKLAWNRINGHQDLIQVGDSDKYVNLATTGGAGADTLRGLDAKTGRVLWTYPNLYAGVHGSHRAPMPSPGLILGPLKINGVAHVNEHLGDVFTVRSNLGTDYVLTTDGLFVTTLFRDARIPGDPIPSSLEAIRGVPLERLSQGEEPFSGWFGRQDDGVIRLATTLGNTMGFVCKIGGLEEVKRFTGGALKITPDLLTAAEKENAARAASVQAGPAESSVPRIESGTRPEWSEIPALDIASPGSPFTGKARLAHDGKSLFVRYEINDPSPWRNSGSDFRRLFKTGDAVDLQIGTDPAAPEDRSEPVAADVRILVAPMGRKPAAVLMRPLDPSAPDNLSYAYSSPVTSREFDRIEILEKVEIQAQSGGDGYIVEWSLPFKQLGLVYQPGMEVRADIGFISSNPQGTQNVGRTYWSNKNTNLTSDEPLESWLFPQTWGVLTFE